MLDVLNLPEEIIENSGKIDNVKMVCILDKQIEMPEHLKKINSSDNNICCLVDIIGVDIKGKKSLVQGKCVTILGPRAFEPTKFGKRVLLLTGNLKMINKESNYVELTIIYPKGNNNFSLYATKTLYREVSEIRNAYSDFMKEIDILPSMNWDMNLYYSSFDIPDDYRVCCKGYQFNDVDKSKKFVFKSDEEYRLSQVNPYKNRVEQVQGFEQEEKELKDVKVEGRLDILEKPKKYYELKSKVKNSTSKLDKEVCYLKGLGKVIDITDKLDYLYNKLKTYWRHVPSVNSATGRAALKNVLEHMYPELKSRYVNNIPYIDNALDNDNILDIWHNGCTPEKLNDNYMYADLVYDKPRLYYGFMDYLLSLRGKLLGAYIYSSILDVDFYGVLTRNPYYLSIMDSRLAIEDLDKLALMFGADLKDENVLKFRNAAYVHNYVLTPNNYGIEEDTLISKDILIKNLHNGLTITQKSYNNLGTFGMILSEKSFENLKQYIKPDMHKDDFVLKLSGWKETSRNSVSKYYLPFDDDVDNKKVLNDYLEIGLGIEDNIQGKEYIMDYTYALKEIYIIDKLYSLQENGSKPKLDDDGVNRCIRGFERQKASVWGLPDVKLEKEQVDAVRALYNPVMCLTGPAGSGKTTTAEAMLYGLQALLGIEEDGIMFCAPTGKAANRLKEVVKKPTRTIHSLFGIGGDSYTFVDETRIEKKKDIKVLIVDEASMINVELMYNMLLRIEEGTRIIFLGDKEQLPPIGAGKPFVNILTFLPCVVLRVTKRASEHSGITKNAEKIISHSEVGDTQLLENFDDFRILEAPMDKIGSLVTGIVNYHIGGFGREIEEGTQGYNRILHSVGVNIHPEDIQVVTPVNKYKWGTRVLNPLLQDVFNPKNSQARVRYQSDFGDLDENGNIRYRELRKNDRVIHLENHARSDRFIYKGLNKFEKIESKGVMNGDVGNVLGFFTGDSLYFENPDGTEDTQTRGQFSSNEETIYVAVIYPGIDEDGTALDYIIFYMSEILHSDENDKLFFSEKIYTVTDTFLRKLDLAYALTVHKLQGSQANLIICVMYPVGYSNFISRNMIYTALTRAVKGIYLVGDVVGNNNAISRGRKIEQNSRKLTITDKLY